MSLQVFRKHANSLVVKGFLGLLVLSFAAWGIGDFLTHGRDSTAIKVDGERVSVYALQKAYQQKKSDVQHQLQGATLTPELIKMFRIKENVVREAVQNTVLRSFAKKLGLTVPDEMVAEAIRIQPQFKGADGNFDKDFYQRALGQAGYTTDSFEHLVREDLMRQQLRHPFLDMTFNVDPALKRFSDQLNEVRDIRAVVVTPRDVSAPAAPTDEELSKLYEEVKGKFTTPEYRSFDVVILDLSKFIPDIKVDEADAQAQYDSHKDQYMVPESRSVQQLVFDTKDDAEAALKDLKAGGDFSAYAAKQDKSKPSDLGTVHRGDLPMPELEKAVFTAEKGGLSDVIETPFGATILRVSDITPAVQQPFASVKDKVIGAMQREMAEAVYQDTLDRLQDAIAGSSHLKDTAGLKHVAVQSFDKVNQSGTMLSGTKVALPGEDTLLQSIFQTDEGTISDQIQLGEDKTAFVEVTGTTPARIKDMAEIKDELVAIFKQRATDAAVMAKAQTILADRNKGQSFEQIARSYNLAEPLQTVPALKRTDTLRNNLLTDQSRTAVFATPFRKGGAVAVVTAPQRTADGNIAVFEVTSTDVAEVPADQMANFSKMVHQAMAQDLFTQFLIHLNRTANIDIHDRMIDSALGDTN